jgi:type I restriction enzyme S subunit
MTASSLNLQIGPFADGWTLTSVKHLAVFQSGASIDSENIKEEGPYAVYGGNGMRGYAENFTHKGEYVLVGRQGALCGNVNYADGIFWASEHALVGHPRRPFNLRWFGELLRTANLGQYSTAAAQPGIAASVVNNLRIPVPSIEVQEAIARFIDREANRIDDLIVEKNSFLTLLREKRVAEISRAVTKGINPDAPMKSSEVDWLGDVPAHWDTVRLGVIFKEAERKGDPTHPVLSVSIHDGVSDEEIADEDRLRKVALSVDRSVYQGVMPGDLVYNMMRAWQGGFGAVTTEGLVSPAYVVARPLSDARTKFIELQLRTPQAVEEMRRYSKGIADFRMRLYWEHFRNVRVALPSPEEQDAILANIDRETTRIDGLIHETEHSIALLKEKRAALITATVTGKIDVRNAA